jgi:CRISPR/Cas system-associated endonuclease Cas1
MGIGLHHDIVGRDSLVWEIMEAVRPALDQLTLDIISSRVWSRRDFHELPHGDVGLRPDWPFLRPDSTSRARALVADVTRWFQRTLRHSMVIAEAVELVANLVAEHAVGLPDSLKTTSVDVPTVLT